MLDDEEYYDDLYNGEYYDQPKKNNKHTNDAMEDSLKIDEQVKL